MFPTTSTGTSRAAAHRRRTQTGGCPRSHGPQQGLKFDEGPVAVRPDRLPEPTTVEQVGALFTVDAVEGLSSGPCESKTPVSQSCFVTFAL